MTTMKPRLPIASRLAAAPVPRVGDLFLINQPDEIADRFAFPLKFDLHAIARPAVKLPVRLNQRWLVGIENLLDGIFNGRGYLKGGMSDGNPTRIKKRANAWEKCSR